MSSDDRNSLKTLDRDLKNVVFGQDKAIDALARGSRWHAAGLAQPRKPIGSYLFSGPTGVGKTRWRASWRTAWASSCCVST